MEKLTNKHAIRYLRRVRQLLPCTRRDKDEITRSVRENLASFLEEQPEAKLSDIQSRFGNPEVVATMYLEQAELPTVMRKLQRRKRVWPVAVASALVVLLSWVGFVWHAQHELQKYVNGHEITEVQVIERDGTPVNESAVSVPAPVNP